MKLKILHGVLVWLALGLSTQALAQTSDVTTFTASDVIRSIDLASRSGVVGGFSYNFGSALQPISVTLYNQSTGSLEMLHPGMKVEIVYIEMGSTRAAISVKELSPDAKVEF